MITYRRRFVVRGEEWFSPNAATDGVDVHEVLHVERPMPGYRCVEFHTLVFDLREDEQTLFSRVRPEARRQIRRCAESTDVVYESFFPCGDEPLTRFFAAYDELAAQKSLPALDRELIATYARDGLLDISMVRKSSGEPLCWHANFRTPTRARQVHSVAFFRSDKAERNLVGRAHRFHTWSDIVRFKNDGLAVFDLGGWYHGDSDEELLRINAFKEEFGGEKVCYYICERGLTLRGKAYLALRNLRGEGMFNNVAR